MKSLLFLTDLFEPRDPTQLYGLGEHDLQEAVAHRPGAVVGPDAPPSQLNSHNNIQV